MAQWRKTFFSLGGPENIADPAAEEALRFGQLLMAKRQQQQALGMERERLGFDQQRHADALRAAGEERLFERQKDQRNFGASREDALFQRGFATSGRDRQAMEADRDYQQRVADMQARREAEAAARALQERTIGGQEQERLMRRESEQDARARAERYRQEDLANAARIMAEKNAREDSQERRGVERAEVLRRTQRVEQLEDMGRQEKRQDMATRAQREREDAAIAAQKAEVAREAEIDVGAEAQNLANLVVFNALPKLREVSGNPYWDPFVPLSGLEPNPQPPTEEDYRRELGGSAPFTAGGFGPTIFGPRSEVTKAKAAISDAIRGDGTYGIATEEERQAVYDTFVGAIRARGDALKAQAGPTGGGEVDYLTSELIKHVEDELARLHTVRASKPKGAKPKVPGGIPRVR